MFDSNFKSCQDLGHDMGRGYEVNIVTALILQSEHQACQLVFRYFLALALVTDVIVLAKQA